MAGLTSIVVFFKPSATQSLNGTAGGVTASNAITTDANGSVVVPDTVVGVLQTGQSIAAVVNTIFRLIPAVSVVFGLAGDLMKLCGWRWNE
jgi:hypothetical protein